MVAGLYFPSHYNTLSFFSLIFGSSKNQEEQEVRLL